MKSYRIPLFLILLAVILSGCMSTPEPVQRKWSDIAYANQSETQKLDIYLPEKGSGPFPVIISIHGGAFLGGDKIAAAAEMAGLERGYALVRVNYRLYREARFPAPVYDVKAAVRFIKANAESYYLDSDRIAVWGDSAGGYLASIIGTSAGAEQLEDPEMGNADQSSAVMAVVDYYGPINFLSIDDEYVESGIETFKHNLATSSESRLFGAPIQEIPDIVNAASPATYISEDDPPFYIVHGRMDRTIPVQQSINFAAALEKVLGEENVELTIIDGADHGEDVFKTDEILDPIFSFLDKHLKKGKRIR